MQSTDITAKVKKFISFGLAGVIALAAVIGYAEYKYWHKDETLQLSYAKVVGTMVSVRILANGKVKELSFEDGAEVKAGDVIARLEVAITEEEIKQLENTVQLAKDNYAQLAQGQWVKVPVQRERVTYPPAPPPTVTQSSSGNLAKLEERANRMAELFEMGAVSAVQRDAARRAYENALANSSSSSYEYSAAPAPIVEYYTEYVDEFRETPAEVLAGAEQAIRQAELSLNVAKQEARETDVIAPVSGTIYYGVEVDQDLAAGDSVSRIGDSRELWIEVEVTEEVFDKIPLGKLASYTIDGKEFFGTVIEKIKPNVNAVPEENQEPVELPDIPTSANAPAALIGENPAQPTENSQPTENPQPAENSSSTEQPQAVQAAVETVSANDAETNLKIKNIIESVKQKKTPPTETPQPQPPKIPDKFEEQQKPNDKFIIKISMPAERDFECRPNTATVVKIKL
ncbi:MAG: biotin/lipoyl-binding protein [Selenomonadaceae bacterium]|nr:biotin/lipoyl-binding protein [Selenomonadaceae bacterium]